jgi:hypothetical protein
MALALALSMVLTLTIGITAYVTRDDRAPAPTRPAKLAPAVRGPEYVAIGDSFTSGGPIGSLQRGANDCQRSNHDYPTQVARATGLSLTDVSCGGASTQDALVGDDDAKAQLNAVTDKAKLVTVSMGGNNHGIFVNVFLGCIQYARADLPGTPCRDKMSAWVAARIPLVQKALADLVAAVQERAPDARVMVINYLRILPDDAQCEAVPYPSGDVEWVAQVERDLAGAMREAAATRAVEFVDMHAKSEGHDVCSDSPWTNGLRPKLRDGLFLHPNANGQRAVAQAVTAAWRRGLSE